VHCRGALSRVAASPWGVTESARRPAISRLVFCVGLRYQVHMVNDSIDKLARLLVEAVPQGLKSVRDDLEQNFQSVLRAGLGKLDLVSREEFEVQQAVLQRTREKLEALEERLKTVESKPAAAAPGKKKTAKKKKSAN
jgi:ubiquinone biosynthesis accessory factor UbiK